MGIKCVNRPMVWCSLERLVKMTEYIYGTDDHEGHWLTGEEIVRCRDCRHAFEVIWPVQSNIPSDYLDCTGELVECWDYYNDEPKDNPVPPNGFCAWGERKSDAE